jgi:hypothetical protein
MTHSFDRELLRLTDQVAVSTRAIGGWGRSLLQKWPVLALILVNMSMTVPLAAILNIWADDACSLNTSGAGVGYAIRQAQHFELQTPLYFVLLAPWRSVDASFFFARLFSVICAALAIYLIATTSKQMFPEVHPAWLASALTFQPFLDIRCDRNSCVCHSSSVFCAVAFFFPKELSGFSSAARFAKLVWNFSCLRVYTHYYIVFLLVANALALVILKRWSLLRSYLVQMIVVGVCFAPMLLVVPDRCLRNPLFRRAGFRILIGPERFLSGCTSSTMKESGGGFTRVVLASPRRVTSIKYPGDWSDC